MLSWMVKNLQRKHAAVPVSNMFTFNSLYIFAELQLHRVKR